MRLMTKDLWRTQGMVLLACKKHEPTYSADNHEWPNGYYKLFTLKWPSIVVRTEYKYVLSLCLDMNFKGSNPGEKNYKRSQYLCLAGFGKGQRYFLQGWIPEFQGIQPRRSF